ncbi:ATPase [Celeribacter sp. PS-C1]|uniref:ATPase n=1 Tax=Celeribacter sp. PS-C1 TaxID=2820813 RepID=UPI001CA50126|nr:ATPase [Celeribacter sp. PS-C1]MBW6417800.1 ATPase [Celeribacter sp. PS-C1]
MTKFHYPEPPKTVEETGLSMSFLINLVAKVMYERGTLTPLLIAEEIKLSKLICRLLIKEMTRLLLVEAQGLESADIKSDIRYSLTDAGRKVAIEAMLASQYVGPAPVTLEAFTAQIKEQSIHTEEIHRDDLVEASKHLVLPKGMMAQLGPAANSGRSVLLYGEPGNGKTSLAQALGDAFSDTVYFPYAMLVGNQIIKFFDETLHEVVEQDPEMPPLDARWVPCRRPVVIAGGELTLPMLDLSFDVTSRFYEAPMHFKALCGVFVLDDFGRQVSTPQEFLNRWIVPLEKGFDILSLHTGRKFMVPFDQLVVFSSNMFPEELGDGASLRRIYFKIYVPCPTREDFLKIFEDACRDLAFDWKPDVVGDFFTKEYEEKQHITSGAHPRFLLQHIDAYCRYEDVPREVTPEYLEIASRNVTASKRRAGSE